MNNGHLGFTDFTGVETRYAHSLMMHIQHDPGGFVRILVENRGNTLSRGLLVDRIWTDGAEYVDENALSVTVKRLRDKLEDRPSAPQYIKTVYGIGYTWQVKS